MKVITLCGSTKYKKQFREMEAHLTLRGDIVLSLGFFEQSEGIRITSEQEAMFKAMHFRKIEMSDEILVIDVDGYIGESTRSEIDFAMQLDKPVRYYSCLHAQEIHYNADDRMLQRKSVRNRLKG